MFPALFGYLSGEVASSAADGVMMQKKFWKNAVFFFLGFTVMMVSLGIIASFVGDAVKPVLRWVQVFAGIVLLFLGLHQMKILRLNFLPNLARMEAAATRPLGSIKAGYLRSFVACMVIAPGWGQIFLGSVLLVVAVNGNLMLNMAHMLAYSLGFGLMFFVTFLFAGPLRSLFKRMGDRVKRIEQLGGAMIIAIGALMIIGRLNWITDLAAWKGGHLIRSLLGI
jgi:cytochrome c-type biogenesis protein